MKLRNGFVSNSSSSSFIIASNNKSLKAKIEIEIDIENFVGHKATTIEELIYYFTENNGYLIEELKDNNSYQQAKKAIELGKTVYFGSFSNDNGNAIENFLCDNGLRDVINTNDIEIIESYGGY